MTASVMLMRGMRRSLRGGHMLGVVVMMGVRIDRSRGRRGLHGGRFDHIQSKLILRGRVSDQRDRNQPRGEPQPPKSCKRHGANLAPASARDKPSYFPNRENNVTRAWKALQKTTI